MRSEVTKLPFWNDLSNDEREMVGAATVFRHYDIGRLIHGSCDGGGSCLGLVYVLSGDIRTYIVSPEGREVTLFKLTKDDFCVFAASCVLSRIKQETQMVPVSSTELMIVPAPIFAKLCAKNIQVKSLAYELATEKLSEVMSVFERILFVPFESRLASYLVEQYRLSGSAELKITQEKVAQEINSAREVVARALNKLAKDDVVSLRRGKIILQDVKQLELMI